MISLVWIGFLVFVVVMLALDLGVLNRKAHVVRAREALAWTGVTVALALAFCVLVYYMYENDWLGVAAAAPALRDGTRPDGWIAATQFLTGWLIEYSLSMDNIFVIAIIFQYFRVPAQYQHRVLFWGILGALVMRGVMIALGAALIARFHWIMYLFGAFLIYTAVKLLFAKDETPEPDKNLAVRLARKFYPVSTEYDGQKFFTMVNGVRAMTPLFLVLLVVETTDVVFAVDSIPAIFGITHDPFLVFTSNVFAILGLRSLYFALAAIIDKFRYLKPSLVLVLGFVGAKMLLEAVVHIPPTVSLGIVVAILGTGVAASVYELARARRAESRGEITGGGRPGGVPEGEEPSEAR